MRVIWFHMQGYRDLPDDLQDRYESVWVTAPNDELCDPETAGRYLNWNLDELEYADDLGFDGVGTNEHHQNGYGFQVSPHMTASVLARRKSDAAICLLGTTLPTYHPLRAAEELAMLDCMSGGRLVTGWPVGTSMDTVGNFGIPPDEVRPRYYEAHDLIKAAWTRPGPFPFNGKYTKLRHVNPWPKPLQRPHPPIWMAGGGSLETYHFAAQNNYTFNYLSFAGYQMARALMQSFWLTAEHHGLDDNPYRAGFAQLVCVADTDAEARRLYEKHVLNFFNKSMYIAPHFSRVPGYMSRESVEKMLQKTGAASTFGAAPVDARPTWDSIVEKQGAVIAGSPDTVAHRLTDMIKGLRIGHLITIMQIQSMPTDLTKHSTKLFAEKVMPRIQRIWRDTPYEDHWWPSGATRNTAPLEGSPAGGAVR